MNLKIRTTVASAAAVLEMRSLIQQESHLIRFVTRLEQSLLRIQPVLEH